MCRMAREETTAEQVQGLAEHIGEIHKAISQIAEMMNKDDVPSVRLHLGTLTNTLIPQIQHWVEIAKVNANDDIRAYLRGVESRSAIQKRYNEKRVRLAAKKAPRSGGKPPRDKK